ncbi:hypothetical protein [Aeromonas schubertii]|uniref:hypothetical protein n=1 Tax=Aeromonas TaxID=642 RepID=UPI00067ED04C|nr:hypothetical protein [Aeromonas schubertii]KUE79817.1 hypothetical protein ATO46_18005 [Aeromonas schubertii]QCG47376.1 hypothetical protein E2P79_05500 [Aeromonas schubertii]
MRALFLLLLPVLPVMALDEASWKSALDSDEVARWQSSREELSLSRYSSLSLEVKRNDSGEATLAPYHRLNLTPDKRVSVGFENLRPRVKFRAGTMDTAVKLRGDGIKVQLTPSDKTIPMQIELKITDDESSLKFDYRF